ncbi:NAD kinase [Amnibacterium endophyticum]|uniref:NAD kinase n=1 Tax=Amnibacterium endophyticum TaxID=2109337 RepID=A0ABW4LBH2_9MICO
MTSRRLVLLLAHTGRDETVEAASSVLSLLQDGDVTPVLRRSEVDDLAANGCAVDGLPVLGEGVEVADLELVVVLGGDGTILRAAELTRGTGVPLLGVNLGHVGFLAEAERDDLGDTIRRVVARDWDVEERLTVEVAVVADGRTLRRDWALNEVTVEKAARERMLELVLEVDGRPLSTFGADGLVVATPTGSTAYAFSAGGPVVWPTLDAMLVVPLSAHALFARPLVLPPASTVAVELLRRTPARGVLWCDGRRMVELPEGSRIEVTASAEPVRLARLHSDRDRFGDRLVKKFDLPVAGWRGPRP